jgi:predicted RNA-binding protein YlxR (DUF448 family)
VRPKRELLRLALDGETVVADVPASRPGRGAYVCDGACLGQAQQHRALGRAFRRGVSVDHELVESVDLWLKSA